MKNLNTYVTDLDKENKVLKPLVDRAKEHANNLKRQADQLNQLIADTKESAAGAVNASNAYKEIVNAINDALNASKHAVDAATKALDMVSQLAMC